MDNRQEPLIHPSTILITLLIAGLSMLFVALSGAYVYNRLDNAVPPVTVPWMFYFNTLFLLGSSLTLLRAKKAYNNDEIEDYKRYLSYTLALSMLFLLSQMIAWYLMNENGMAIDGAQNVSYLYLIPMIHFLHLVGGIPFLIYLLVSARKRLRQPESALVFFSDPARKRRLFVISTYWHFVDILWVYLIVFFTVNAFI